MYVMRTHQLLQFALRQDLGMRSRKREEVVVGNCVPRRLRRYTWLTVLPAWRKRKARESVVLEVKRKSECTE